MNILCIFLYFIWIRSFWKISIFHKCADIFSLLTMFFFFPPPPPPWSLLHECCLQLEAKERIVQPCFQIPLLFESNTATIPRPTFVIKMFVCHRTCVCRFKVLCRIPSTDWKKPGGLTREKRHDATRRWKALTVGVAVTLTVPRTYVKINCSLALSFFSVTRRVIYVEDKGGGFLAHTAATSADSSARNDNEAKKRARELTGHIVRCMCRDCMGTGKQVHLSASWSRANGIACVFLHLKDLKDQVNDSSILRMMTRIDSWTDYSIWSDPSRLSYSGHRSTAPVYTVYDRR